MCSPTLPDWALKFLLLMAISALRALGFLGALRHVCLCDPAHLGECPRTSWQAEALCHLRRCWVSLKGRDGPELGPLPMATATVL